MSLVHELRQRSVPIRVPDRAEEVTFQAISWYASDVDFAEIDGDDGEKLDQKRYVIKIFGITEGGQTISVSVKDFTPFFYVRIDEKWGDREVGFIREHIISAMPKKLQHHLRSVTIQMKKDFWGFTNFKEFKFLRFCFSSLEAMRKVQYMMQNYGKALRISNLGVHKFTLYETNIDPYIKFIHLKDLEPSGWITLPGGAYRENTEILPTTCQYDLEISWKKVQPCEHDAAAKFLIASFDIECMSATGDFPVPKKDYQKLASDIVDVFDTMVKDESVRVLDRLDIIRECLRHALGLRRDANNSNSNSSNNSRNSNDKTNNIIDADDNNANNEIIKDVTFDKYIRAVHKVTYKSRKALSAMEAHMEHQVKSKIDEIMLVLDNKLNANIKREEAINKLKSTFKTSMSLPSLEGDAIIQIGTTFHYYGEKEVCHRHIVTLGSCDPIDNDVELQTCATESELLMAWRDMINAYNPDVITGYNIFGFDMSYMKDRAEELGIYNEFAKIGRFRGHMCNYLEKALSSSALGDNLLKFIDMDGRVLIDMMKVVQRDHKLDSYKLDLVASHFLKKNKHDVSPNDIFRLQAGTSADRKVIAEYCIQDCALCNYLMMKLEIIANNMGMSNVCLVPLSFIFMRGQGVKIFSLVLKQCKDDGFVIPVVRPPKAEDKDTLEDEDSYEGAIVLEPKTGIYLDTPISVLDYASLYPSSMISENLSHDCIVIDSKYDNLPGVEYLDISYDLYEGTGDKKHKVGEKVCRFVQLPNGEKGVIPRILMKLLKARKTTRKKIEWQLVKTTAGEEHVGFVDEKEDCVTVKCVGDREGQVVTVNRLDVETITDYFNEFQKAVLDGLQLAYKITANSLYGQVGARTSPIHLKDIAACTTATGRNLIMKAKTYIEASYPDAAVVYGDTDSLFVSFGSKDSSGQHLSGPDARMRARNLGIQASQGIKKLLKPPHDLEWEKLFHPFILLSKKRYVGNKYEHDDHKFKQTSMGIVLKRRDNANIVKKVYGGIIDIILNKQDIDMSMDFLKQQLEDLIQGKAPIDELIITKSLRADYKDPDRIAHKVLAERIGERDPGNKPQVNDRIPFVYVEQPPPPPGVPKSKHKILQGERIEHPDFIKSNNLRPDYAFYITNQIMKPVLQVYGIVADKIGIRTSQEYQDMYNKYLEEAAGNHEKAKDKLEALKEKDVKRLLFDPHLEEIDRIRGIVPTRRGKAAAAKAPTFTDADGVELPKEVVAKLPKAPKTTKTKKPKAEDPPTTTIDATEPQGAPKPKRSTRKPKAPTTPNTDNDAVEPATSPAPAKPTRSRKTKASVSNTTQDDPPPEDIQDDTQAKDEKPSTVPNVPVTDSMGVEIPPDEYPVKKRPARAKKATTKTA